MHMYIIKNNTKGKLLTQSSNKDIRVDDFSTTKNLEFSDAQLIIDYVRYKNAGGGPPKNLAERLASQGYSVFCTGNINDKYLLAVPSATVEVL